jgi:dTDP-4-amino-4,6-dideoxy-D-galactose acyltransferase
MKFNYLEWDSSFFGKKICKVDANSSDSLTDIKDHMEKEGIDMCYIFSKDKMEHFELEGAKLVDEKTIFSKPVMAESKLDTKQINSYSGIATDQLKSLALLSGTFSRFRIDEMLNHKFKDLYTIWLERSLKHEIADDVLIFYENSEMAGFVSYKIVGDVCIIGLIAVDAKYQGLKIGTKLLRAVEECCLRAGAKKIDVATQGLNKQACAFYEKAGYLVTKVENIYHYSDKE